MRPLLIAGFAILLAGNAPAAAYPSPSLSSYTRAKRVLDAGVAAMGGEAALRGLHGVRRDLTDHWVDIGQQQRPWRGPIFAERLPVGERIEVVSYLDYASADWAKSHTYDDGPGQVFRQVDVATQAGGFGKGLFYDEKPFLSDTSAEDAAAARAGDIRRYPEGLLRLGLERPEALQWVGVQETDGRRLEVISLDDPQGKRVFLYFDAATHLPARSELLRDHAVLGDTTAEVVYEGYRRVGALTLPYRYIDRVGGIPTHMMTAQAIDAAAPLPAELFARPAQVARVEAPPAEPTLNDRGGGVYEILGLYNVMFAVFRDHVLLIEAPLGEAYVEACLKLIASVAPGKPVRAVSTHFHYDHIGGARALVARGVPILTTADAKEMIGQALQSRKTLHPDLYSRAPKPPVIEVAAAKTVFDDGAQRVEIYDIGPSEHVAHLLVAYFPEQKTLHVADLWDVLTPQQAIAGADAEFVWREAARLGLEVERMVPVHGVPAGAADLRRGLAIRARHLELARRAESVNARTIPR